MKTINFRGHKYVQSNTPHKKCEDGTHWNEKKKKCLPLDAESIKRINKATKASDAAHREGTSDAHSLAGGLHDNAAGHLHSQGFHELSQHHRSRTDHHGQKMMETPTRSQKEQGK